MGYFGADFPQIVFYIMKKSILSIALLAMCASMFAQISTGEPNSSIIPRTGNRPQAGDYGLYVGGSVSQVMDLIHYCNSNGDEGAYGLPIINLKYYCTDKVEFRMGFQFAAQTKKRSTTTTSGSTVYTSSNFLGKDFTRLTPGVAYHFNTNNLLDVYIGAQLPIGFDAESQKTTSSNREYYKESSATFVVGGGLFFGLQFFIADLPIAIGVEGGYSGLFKAQSVPYVKEYTATSGELKYHNGTAETTAQWGADAAITFSYFFHN